ncbi:MAG TPA: SUF system NifU family Fe-S cluster assembly protein [Armatimonadota bacterium]|nr:SUF system NifU family Fe-S cluster assembly protein [Armatimonadota bacterium]
MSMENLYQQIILDHYKHPRNFGEVLGCTVSAEHDNPSCGDQIRIHLLVQDGKVEKVQFSGKGCAISQASASMMTEALKGKTVAEAQQMVDEFRQMMRGEKEYVALDEAGELEALKGVLQFPVRVKCAVLAWDTMDACIHMQENGEDTPPEKP